MKLMAILDHRLLRPLEAPAGNFDRLLGWLWRDEAGRTPARPFSFDACSTAAQDPLLLAEWLRATDNADDPIARRTP
jgi:hypothetical protein